MSKIEVNTIEPQCGTTVTVSPDVPISRAVPEFGSSLSTFSKLIIRLPTFLLL